MSNIPKCATDKRFRSACGEKLVELGQARGLAVKAELEDENAVLVFPRFGQDPINRKQLLELHWYHVDKHLTFTKMPYKEVEDFLDELAKGLVYQ